MNGYDQKQTLYWAVTIGNLDKTVDFESETPDLYETEEEAVAAMKEEAESELPVVIYRMTPIIRSVRKMKFERINK